LIPPSLFSYGLTVLINVKGVYLKTISVLAGFSFSFVDPIQLYFFGGFVLIYCSFL